MRLLRKSFNSNRQWKLHTKILKEFGTVSNYDEERGTLTVRYSIKMNKIIVEYDLDESFKIYFSLYTPQSLIDELRNMSERVE